jgi:hypothetical protein
VIVAAAVSAGHSSHSEFDSRMALLICCSD